MAAAKGTRAIGIDPGLKRMGWAVLEKTDGPGGAKFVGAGVFQTERKAVPHAFLLRCLRRLFRTHRPAVVAVERLFFGRNRTTLISVAQARGIVLLAAEEAGLPVREYTCQQARQAVAAYGGADKPALKQWLERVFSLKNGALEPDAADALALAFLALAEKR